MKQDRAALEDRDVSIGQPRHLAEGLVREMLGIPSAKLPALGGIGQPGLFQCPTHTYVTHIAPRRFGNPIEGGEDQIDHSACLLSLKPGWPMSGRRHQPKATPGMGLICEFFEVLL